jgi:hypothetical protein
VLYTHGSQLFRAYLNYLPNFRPCNWPARFLFLEGEMYGGSS